jgi:mono/diheme cytochrome c family protein
MRYLSLSLLLLFALSACNANPPSTIAFDALPETGDAARGADLFNQPIDRAPPCSACHIEGNAASPDLSGFGERAASRVAGESAREYAFYSITEPGRFIVEGFGNAMYNTYDEKLSAQDIADLIAYLLKL